MKAPIHILKGINQLTTEIFEKKLRTDEKSFFTATKTWKAEALANGLFIDLSQVRWVNLGTATQLVLFVEAARKNGIRIFISLPYRRLTADEAKSKSFSSELKEQIRNRREQANQFLKLIHFDKAVRCEHIAIVNRVVITEEFEFADETDTSYIERLETAFSNPFTAGDSPFDYSKFNYRYILPLTWISVSGENSELRDFESKFQDILADPERGLSNIDVLSLKNVIISELVKNVREHAGSATRHALISVGLIAGKAFIPRKWDDSKINTLEKDYIVWVAENKLQSLIEINFGDTGTGLVSDELENAYFRSNAIVDHKQFPKQQRLNILKWAFSKWSTRKVDEIIRGTKGLYRINRIVNKYNGLILIRTADLNGGFQKGGYSSSSWLSNGEEKLFSFPGTFVQLKLCPYKEARKIAISFRNNTESLPWFVTSYQIQNDSIEEFIGWINNLERQNHHANLLLIFESVKPINVDIEKKKDFLGSALKYLSNIRHPNGIVVYIADEIGKELLDEIANSTNQLILKDIHESENQESISPDIEIAYDPVLIIGKGNTFSWFGGDQKVVDILNELYQTPGTNQLSNLKSFYELSDEERLAIIAHFRNDDSLVVVTENMEIQFNFSSIPNIFENRLKLEFERVPERPASICTPKLKIISKWYNLKTLVPEDETIGMALAMYLKVIETIRDVSPQKSTYILIDHNQQLKIAIEFAKLLGVSKRNIVSVADDVDYNIPRRTMLFNKGDDVVILTTIVSSSETIRRLVKLVKRDLANAICIVSLVNLREANVTFLKTWKDFTPIISVYQKNTDEFSDEQFIIEERKQKSIEYHKLKAASLKDVTQVVSPDYVDDLPIDRDKIVAANLIPQILKEYICDKKALYFSHIGKFNGRHFTFFLDKRKLLASHSFIWQAFERELKNWTSIGEKQNLAILRPLSQREDNDPLEKIANWLGEVLNIRVVESWPFQKGQLPVIKNLIYMDFGALTGNSINKVLSNIRGVDNVLICILFSQFINDEAEFYKKLSTIKVEDIRKENVTQPSLFTEDIETPMAVYKSATVQIKFLFDLPFNFYRSSNCPICEHERALETYRMQDEYMRLFTNDRKTRLKIRERVDMFDFPCDFYADLEDSQNELSSRLIINMYELKLLLEYAVKSTEFRIKLHSVIFRIFENFNEYLDDPESELFGLMYLISHEVIWLQKEPFVFKDFRSMIASIAERLAVFDLKAFSQIIERRNNVQSSAFKIAVRFKYAAVTVLRSSDKLKFCESISSIILSSQYDGRLSDNIAQNTFYHINSLQQNVYNKSDEYFKIIGKEIGKVTERLIIISPGQQTTLHKINLNNKRILRRLELGAIKSDLQIVKNLKQEIAENYNGKNHPDPIEHFAALDFSQLDDFFDDLKQYKSKSLFYSNFDSIRKTLKKDWEIVSNYLEQVVHVHLGLLSDKIRESKAFKTSYIYENIANTFAESGLIGGSDRFTELVYVISDDVLNLIPHYAEYSKLHQHVYNHFIKASNIRQYHGSDCTLMKLLSNFPASLVSIVHDIFAPAEFAKFYLDDSGIRSDSVFYSHLQLNKYFRLIRANIVRRLNPGLTLKDVSILIKLSEFSERQSDFIRMRIEYSGTDKWEGKANENGTLREFNEDLAKFGGSLKFCLDDQSKLFIIDINYVLYD